MSGEMGWDGMKWLRQYRGEKKASYEEEKEKEKKKERKIDR